MNEHYFNKLDSSQKLIIIIALIVMIGICTIVFFHNIHVEQLASAGLQECVYTIPGSSERSYSWQHTCDQYVTTVFKNNE